MRARVFAFWLVFATASSSFAQNAVYSQFPAASADICATACTSDKMCASWSFGGKVPTVETASRRNRNMEPPARMCALSKSGTPAPQSGFKSGLPRRSGALTPNGRHAVGPANYEVRPAPWLNPAARMPQPVSSTNQGAPIGSTQSKPTAPTSSPSAGRVDFIPLQSSVAPAAPVESSAPRVSARGTPQTRASEDQPVQQSSFVPPGAVAAAPPSPPPMNYSPQAASSPIAAPQPMQSQATPRQAADLSKFRGADGMVDAAAMRRSQLNSARASGQPAYAVQREWEAVEAERQRAAAMGYVRADPLAGTVPVPETPQPKSTRRSPSYEAPDPNKPSDESKAAPQIQKPISNSKGARGTPRAERSNQAHQRALADAARLRSRHPSYIDREPRLSGGAGG